MVLLNSLLIRVLKVSTANVEMKVRGFDCPDLKMKDHLEQIGITFLTGYHAALQNSEKTTLEKIAPMYVGFAQEGTAMGLALTDILTFSKRKRISSYIKKTPQHIYMLHVGIGWALARVPFINIERFVEKFDPLLKGLIIDGYGFHEAYFKTKKYVYDAKEPSRLNNSASLHTFYQGVGRALWFIYGGQPSKINSKITSFKTNYHPDLWSGIGLASAYAGGVSKENLLELQLLGNPYEDAMAQGVAFACKARLLANNMMEHTEMASEIFCGINAMEASGLTDQAYDKIVHGHPTGDAYNLWRQKIMDNFKNQFSYESNASEIYQ